MRIGELSRITDYPSKTIRFYEQIGLLPAPQRTESGYRDYDADHSKRLEFISKAKRLGLSLDQIRDIIALREDGQTPCLHVQSLLADRLAELRRVRAELDQLEVELESTLRRNSDAGEQSCASSYCSVIEHGRMRTSPLPLAEGALKRRPRRSSRDRRRSS